MKKYLLLIISMVCAVTGAWATPTYLPNRVYGSSLTSGYIYQGESLTILSTAAGDIATDATNLATKMQSAKYIYIAGPIGTSDIQAINNASTSTQEYIDYSYATGIAANEISVSTNFEGLGLPAGSTVPDEYEGLHYIWSVTWNAEEDSANGNTTRNISINFLTKDSATEFNGHYSEYTSNYNPYCTNNVTMSATGIMSNDEKTYYQSQVSSFTFVNSAPVDGCIATIDLSKRESKTMAKLISEVKTAVIEGGESAICTLNIKGEMTNDDLAALNSTDLSGATRIDLSGATIASSSSIENIALPASLEQLVLPKGMGTAKLPDALRTKFAGAANLMYAYSPTSNTQTVAAQHVADLVWVNKAGGLDKAIINEAKLRTAVYVKVESSVALNADDVDLATNNKQTGENTYENVSLDNISTDATNYAWQYIDMSGANLQNDVIVSYKAPQTTNSYRLILPDGWGPNRMSIIPSVGESNYGKGLAAVYSYTAQGFLQILEIKDTEYKTGALADNRIVRDGTKAIRVVRGTYNETTYGVFGQTSQSAGNNNLLAAINGAAESIEAVTITDVTTGTDEPLTFDNDNLIYIQLHGVKSFYDNEYGVTGPIVNVEGCAKLGTLNIINSELNSLTANKVSSLTTVNLTGTAIKNNTNLSETGITSSGFLTDSDTEFQGDLNLSKTALTTFTTTAKVGTSTANTGNINLNENNLTGVSLNQVQFQNTSSIVYVRKAATDDPSTTEVDETKVLTGTLGDNSIIVPKGFDAEHRIVPYVPNSVKEEKYVAPAYVFSATGMYLHEKETTGETPDKFVYWYTGTLQDNKVLTITMTDERRGTLATLLGSGNANITSSTDLVRFKIVGPLASNDLAALASVNAQILDLSEATFYKYTAGDPATYTVDNSIIETGSTINQYAKFLLLPAGMTRDDVYNGDTKVSDGIVNKTSLAGFTGLYSAISLTDYNPNNAFDFTSYNKVAGTLQPAVIAAGRGTLNGSQMIRGEEGNTRTAYYPTMSGNYNRSATISGLINAYDLSYSTKLDADGHLKFNKRYANESLDADDRTNAGTETNIQGAFSGSNGPRTLDLKAAEITGPEYINDICISYLVPTNMLKYLIIPETKSVKETPSYFITHNTVKEICIPSNIEVIRTHFAPSVDHIWTNAASGDITGTKYDNGAFSAKSEEDAPTEANYGYTDFTFSGLMPYGTYTFSSNLKMIESHAFANTQPHVKDVYVLATTAPECHVDAFCTGMYVGNSGFSPDVTGGVITRDSYVNGTNWITMLHYPRQCISPEVQRYTDPTRSYNIASNEIDGKGGVLYYPSYGEFLAAYAQGTTGYLWNAFDRTYEFGMLKNSLSIENTGWTLANQRSANSKFLKNPDLIADNTNTKWTCTSFYDVTAGGTETQPTNLAYYYNVRWDEKNLYNGGETGVLLYPLAKTANTALSFNVNTNGTETDATDDTKVTTRDYRGWHQFVLNAYAANTDIPVVPSRSYVTDSDWWTICLPYDLTYNETMLFFGTANDDGTVASDKVPYVCLLSNVVRDHVNNHITLNFSSNLMNHKASKSENGIWSIDANNAPNHDIAKDIKHGGTADIVIHAGVPYLIKPVFPANAKRQFDIYGPTGVVDAALSSGRITATDTQYPGLYDKLHAAQDIAGSTFLSMLQDNLYTVPALLPKDTYDSSKEAYVDDTEYTYLDKTYYRSNAYDYTFVGSFMKNVIPPYCYFLGVKGGKAAFIYADYLDLDGNDPVKAAKKYKYMNTMMWNNNSGVICPNMFASTSDKHFYRLAHTGGHDGEIEVASGSGENMKPARWEIFTTTNNTMSNMLPKDDFSSKSPAPAMLFGFDLPQGTTGIDNNMTTSISFEDENVYSLNGRFVGTTLEGLAKGVYIRNGKKIVVK